MPQLRQSMLDRFQQQRFPEAWRPLLHGLDVASDAIDPTIEIGLEEQIYPNQPYRALLNLSPDQVRIILFGEDPYPTPNLATGRAFEPGDLCQWQRTTNPSPRRLAQQLADFRHPDRNYGERRGGWASLKEALTASPPELQLPTPANTFDRWEEQGVLLLNTVLTASQNHIARRDACRADHRRAHRSFWAPVVRGICRRLAELDQATVFLCWGVPARNFVRDTGIITSTVCPFPVDDTSFPQTKVLVRDHPCLPFFWTPRTSSGKPTRHSLTSVPRRLNGDLIIWSRSARRAPLPFPRSWASTSGIRDIAPSVASEPPQVLRRQSYLSDVGRPEA